MMVRKQKPFWKKLLDDLRDIDTLKRFVKKAVTENVALKLIAAVITLTLFLLIAGESVQISKTVKIEYITAEDMMIVNNIPFEFEMIISGPKSTLSAARERDLLYKVDLSNAGAGVSRVRINARRMKLDRGVIVSSVMPSIVYPRLEEISSKKVPIILDRRGAVREGKLSSLELKPAEVTISGPASKVDRINQIFTDPFDLSKISKSGTYPITLKIPNSHITAKDISQEQIEVEVKVGE